MSQLQPIICKIVLLIMLVRGKSISGGFTTMHLYLGKVGRQTLQNMLIWMISSRCYLYIQNIWANLLIASTWLIFLYIWEIRICRRTNGSKPFLTLPKILGFKWSVFICRWPLFMLFTIQKIISKVVLTDWLFPGSMAGLAYTWRF